MANYFNSIKVQLELKIVIKVLIYALFQFHKGTIRTIILRVFFQQVNYFNSIKVQLEQKCKRVLRRQNLFQFHKGTIRTHIFASFFDDPL